MEPITGKIDTFKKGHCPECGKEVARPEEGKISICDCGERFIFHIAYLLRGEAALQGTNATIKKIFEKMPAVFYLQHSILPVSSSIFSGHLTLQDIDKNPALYNAVVAEGSKIVQGFIAEKRKEIEQQYGFDIGTAGAATIIAFMNLMRVHERDYKDLMQNIVVVQDPVKLKKNEYGEFALSHFDQKNCLYFPYVKKTDGNILTCRPEIEIRSEQVKNNKLIYIKCGLDTFVAAYIREDWPPDSIIYIFHKGYIPPG